MVFLVKIPKLEKTKLRGVLLSRLRKLFIVVVLCMKDLIWKFHIEIRHREVKENRARNSWGKVEILAWILVLQDTNDVKV